MNYQKIKEDATAQGVNLSESQVQRISKFLLPLVEEKFKDMQVPYIEYLTQDDGKVMLKVGYIFE